MKSWVKGLVVINAGAIALTAQFCLSFFLEAPLPYVFKGGREIVSKIENAQNLESARASAAELKGDLAGIEEIAVGLHKRLARLLFILALIACLNVATAWKSGSGGKITPLLPDSKKMMLIINLLVVATISYSGRKILASDPWPSHFSADEKVLGEVISAPTLIAAKQQASELNANIAAFREGGLAHHKSLALLLFGLITLCGLNTALLWATNR